MPYEWDEAKRRGNIVKHGIDFESVHLFDWTTASYERSVRHGEERVLALGYIGDRLHAVVYIGRGANARIISVRKAKRKEENRYAAP